MLPSPTCAPTGIARRREHILAEEQDLFTEDNYAPNQIDELINEEWAGYMVNHVIEHSKNFFSGKAIEVFQLSSKGMESSEISKKLEIPDKYRLCPAQQSESPPHERNEKPASEYGV